MNPNRWQRIDRLYHSALEVEASRRAGFLEEASAGDEELRCEVEALLAANEEAPRNFLAASALEVAAEAVASDQEAPLGQMLGHYRMLSHLGKGGMADVYLAQDTRLPRKAALKLFPKEYTRDRERFRRFEQEARAASALNHPNIITIYEILECEGRHFIVTEFVEGETLRVRLPGPLMKLREILDIAIQVAGALAAAHEAGIVHRDIKPENIMVRRDGYVKVLDFGLAKLIEPLSPAGTAHSASPLGPALDTDPERVMGTARYMSPEQVLGRQIDGRNDIFSLGTVLFEMLTGVAPFQGETAGEVFRAVLNHEPPPIAAYRKDANAELERIVRKTLTKDRDERYQVVKDLLIDLKSLKEDLAFESRRRRDTQTTISGAGAREEPDTIQQPVTAVPTSGPARAIPQPWEFEPPGGALELNSNSYIVRSADHEFHSAITRHDSVVLVKGPRQVGKTSLLARGLQKAREAGACVMLSDFQNLSARSVETIDSLLQALSELIADQLNLDMLPAEIWNRRLSPSINFEHFLRRNVFEKFPAPIVWGLDEVDWLFTCEFGSEVFGLFRSWHNKRALDPSAPWHRFTLAIAYATEAHLFITDLNQSPFNVGTRLTLEDFSIDQVEEFNRRYGSPLKNRAELARFYRLVGGHPYLVHCGLHEMVVHGLDLHALESLAGLDEGPFGDHLRRLLVSLSQDPALCNVMRAILQGQPCPTSQSFFRLRGAGLIAGESAQFVRPRCQLYATYLESHVL